MESSWTQGSTPGREETEVTCDRLQVVHINAGTVGPGGHQAAQLRLAAVLVMPANGIHKLVVLLDGADQLQAGNLEYFYWSTIGKTPR